MENKVKRQIIISGLGGQGVLFITRILAEAAVMKGIPVLTSETHGMAQRGGNVVSHLKTGGYSSPLIRPGQGDLLLALASNTVEADDIFLKQTAWKAVNSPNGTQTDSNRSIFYIDAVGEARKSGSPKAANLVLLGFAAGVSQIMEPDRRLFCNLDDIREVIQNRFASSRGRFEQNMTAFELGAGLANQPG